MGEYDSYGNGKTLSQRIGNILEGVNKYEEQKMKEGKGKSNKEKEKVKEEELADLDLLDFGDEKFVKKQTTNVDDNINFLDA